MGPTVPLFSRPSGFHARPRTRVSVLNLYRADGAFVGARIRAETGQEMDVTFPKPQKAEMGWTHYLSPVTENVPLEEIVSVTLYRNNLFTLSPAELARVKAAQDGEASRRRLVEHQRFQARRRLMRARRRAQPAW